MVGDGELGAAELADLGALDAPAELQRDELHPVTDAEHRYPELEQLRIELGRVVGVDRRRAAGEDQALRLAPGHLLGADVMRQQLAEHPALAHPARDELRILPAVVEDDDLVDRARDVERRALVRQLRAGGGSSNYAVLAQSARRRPSPPLAASPRSGPCWRTGVGGSVSAPCQERRSLSGSFTQPPLVRGPCLRLACRCRSACPGARRPPRRASPCPRPGRSEAPCPRSAATGRS